MKTTKSLLDKVCLLTNGEMVEISKRRKVQWVGGSAKIEVVYSDGYTGFEHIEDLDLSKDELENLGFDLTV